MKEKILLYKGSSLHYQLRGEGKVVVLLHGFGEDGSIWDNLAASLSTNYRLLKPDLPGSGSSSMLSGDNIGLEDYADSIHAILLEENIEECTMIGHSMGGYITLAFAEKYPQMLHSIGLFHSSAYEDDEAKKETRKKAIEFIKDNGSFAFLKTSIPGLFRDTIVSKPEIDKLLEKGKQFLPEAITQYYRAMIARPDRTFILKKIACPILFIMGVYDKAVPFEQSLQQSHMPELSHIHVLRNSAHMGMLEEPEKSLLIFTHFLQAIYV